MIEIPVFDSQYNKKDVVRLPEAFDAIEVSGANVHSAVIDYLANQRQGTHATKTRGLVRGGGKKPWKQKHTGRARSGSIRSPLWRGGGIVFGPQPRDYSQKMPVKAKKKALHDALVLKIRDAEVLILDSFIVKSPRTKAVAELLCALGIGEKSVLIVLHAPDTSFYLSARNIPGVCTVVYRDLNPYQIASFEILLFTSEAFAIMEKGLWGGMPA